MRVNIMGLLRQAENLAEAQARKQPHAGMVAFGLSELREHLLEVAKDPNRWGEFAECYCLTERDLAKADAA